MTIEDLIRNLRTSRTVNRIVLWATSVNALMILTEITK